MKTILIGLITILMNISGLQCSAQTSKLPKEMPEKTEISFSQNGGMLNAFTKILISNQTISVESKKGNEPQPRKRTAKIEKAEQEKLYQLFVDNKFDTIKNDEPNGIVYDAGSESIYINLGNSESYNKSYGPNSPMSGTNQKRYQAIATAIQALRDRYEDKAQKSVDSNFKVFEYDPKQFSWIFKNASPTTLSDDESAEVKSLLKKAVGEHNSKQNNNNQVINIEKYKFQFVSAINSKGEKEVWANSFCTDFEDWQKQIVQVDDGGKCFFNLYINLTKKSYDRFSINGDT
ncbi:MAG: cystatin domain-containing protein [Actinomycetota bacterium]